MEHQVLLDPLEQVELQVRQEPQVRQERVELQVIREHQALLAPLEQVGLPEHLVRQELQVHREQVVLLELLVHLEHRVLLELPLPGFLTISRH